MVVTLAMGLAALRRGGLGRWAAFGALLGLGTLTRAHVFIFFPGFALGALLWLRSERRGWFVPLLVAGVTMALTVTPWIVRNHGVWHRWYFISTGGGRQFYFGNNPYTDCKTTVPALPDPAIQAELDRIPTTFGADSLYYRRGWEFVFGHPQRAAQL
jgi:4-amino-4-deoxy-L-arabinose transferase-like glycosyltransferase